MFPCLMYQGSHCSAALPRCVCGCVSRSWGFKDILHPRKCPAISPWDSLLPQYHLHKLLSDALFTFLVHALRFLIFHSPFLVFIGLGSILHSFFHLSFRTLLLYPGVSSWLFENYINLFFLWSSFLLSRTFFESF